MTLMPLAMADSEVAKCLRACSFQFVTERQLQDAIHVAFCAHRLPATREVHLTPADRIDFMVGRVGVEVKVGGSVIFKPTTADPARIRKVAEAFLARTGHGREPVERGIQEMLV